MPLVTWKYSDWDLKTSPAEKLERLRRHIQEVSGFVLKTGGGKGRSQELDPEYMPQLQAEKLRLERMVVGRTAMKGRFGVSSFNRGSGS